MTIKENVVPVPIVPHDRIVENENRLDVRSIFPIKLEPEFPNEYQALRFDREDLSRFSDASWVDQLRVYYIAVASTSSWSLGDSAQIDIARMSNDIEAIDGTEPVDAVQSDFDKWLGKEKKYGVTHCDFGCIKITR